MDWYETPQPTGAPVFPFVPCVIDSRSALFAEIRQYMYETLMYLVGVHAQVSNAAAPLLERTLNALVEDVAEEALRCFKQVKRFGMGGMLRVSNLSVFSFRGHRRTHCHHITLYRQR